MITPRPYQTPAINALAGCKLGHVVSPAGSGKTIIAALALKQLEAEKGLMSVLWIAYTTDLLDQGREACEKCGVQSAVEFKCMQGLSEIPASVDLLILDECHHCTAPESKRVIRTTLKRTETGWERSCITWGLTATPEREDGESIVPVIGPCVCRVDPQAVKEAGGVLGAIVRTEHFRCADIEKKIQSESLRAVKGWMNDEQKNRAVYRVAKKIGITENEERIAWVAFLAREKVASGKSVICLFETVAECQAAEELCPQSRALYSKLRDRAQVLDAFRDGQIRCIFCTSLADEGLDAPIASVLILARAGKAPGRLEQRAGRVLRPYNDKRHGLIIDVRDRTHGMFEAQYWQRLRTYKRLGYEIEAKGDR